MPISSRERESIVNEAVRKALRQMGVGGTGGGGGGTSIITSNSPAPHNNLIGNDRWQYAGLMSSAALLVGYATVANFVLFAPIVAATSRRLARWAISVQANVAGAQERFALYEADAQGLVGAKVPNSEAGPLVTATTGFHQVALATPPLLVPGKLYYAGMASSHAHSTRGVPLANAWPVGGVTGAVGSGIPQIGFQVAHAFGAMPNPVVGASGIFANLPGIILLYADP